MPVLTAYAPQPVHSTGWASLNRTARFPSRTSRFEPMVPKGSLLFRIHTKQKRCKPQIEKTIKYMEPSPTSKQNTALKKQSVAVEISKQEVPSCVPVIKGILMKPGSVSKTYQSASPVAGSEIALVAGSTSAQCPPGLSGGKSVIKKVRFSGQSVLQGQPSLLPQGLAADESTGLLHDSYLEPVTETIFFTHSSYSYDRSPIAVDKVLNKSLNLPPRTQLDALSGGRWLPSSRSTRHYDSQEGAPALDNHSQKHRVSGKSSDELNPNDFSAIPPAFTPPWRSMGHSQRGRFEFTDPEFIPNAPNSPDGPHLSSLSPTHSKCCSSAKCIKRFSPKNYSLQLDPVASLVSIPFSEIEEEQQIVENSTSNENITCHSFSNLKLEEIGEGIEDRILEVDGIFGIGNWTRAQVFGSCDALDGF